MAPEPREDELSRLLADLKEHDVLAAVRGQISRGVNPMQILESCQRGMRVVGQLYEKGTYFISGLIIAGEIMREIGKLVLPLLASNIEQHDSGTILLGTVEGDIHFIGKDVFKVLARCHGFRVHDLGVNVPPGEFLSAARKTSPAIIGISCLLSSCFDALRNTISLLKEGLPDSAISFMVGGIVDRKVGEYVGADHTVNDAMVGIRICKEIMTISGVPHAAAPSRVTDSNRR